MTPIYLSSEIHFVAKSIFKDISRYKKSFKTVFITTGSEDRGPRGWVEDNRQGLIDAGFEVFDYTLTGKTESDIDKDLADVDVIHVNGGSCYKICKEAIRSGFDKFVKKKLGEGVVYVGSSGGSISATTDISRIYRQDDEEPFGLGLTDVLIVPHWGRPDRHDLALKERLPIIIEDKLKLVMLNDNQYLKVVGSTIEFIDVRD